MFSRRLVEKRLKKIDSPSVGAILRVFPELKFWETEGNCWFFVDKKNWNYLICIEVIPFEDHFYIRYYDPQSKTEVRELNYVIK